ncbi:MAG: helix-turn-helix domain-containing protein [Acidobacteriota bacterium]
MKGIIDRLIHEMIDKGIKLEEAKKEFEKKFIAAALEKSSGNRSKAARVLGVHRNTISNKISNLKI